MVNPSGHAETRVRLFYVAGAHISAAAPKYEPKTSLRPHRNKKPAMH
jgi:hypothetical protein